MSVPASGLAVTSALKPSLGMNPATTVAGDCGTSSVVILDDFNGNAAVSTGFKLYQPAVQYSWAVVVLAIDSGTYRKPWSGFLGFTRNWSASFKWTVPANGSYWASVTPGSYATLNNGGMCYSGVPSDEEWIYRR